MIDETFPFLHEPLISGDELVGNLFWIAVVVGRSDDLGKLDKAEAMKEAKEAGLAVITYGVFINAVISFIIVAWILFMVIKGVNRLKRAEAEAEPEAPAGPSQEDLLAEIRDLLAKQA